MNTQIIVDGLEISSGHIRTLLDNCPDVLSRLKVNRLLCASDDQSDGIELFIKIAPKILELDYVESGFHDLKAYLNSGIKSVNLKYLGGDLNFTLTFTNCPVFLIDSYANQSQSFKGEQSSFYIITEKFSKLRGVEANISGSKSKCLFIPFSSVNRIKTGGNQRLSSGAELDQYLKHFEVHESGFVIPFICLHDALFELDKIFADLLSSNESVLSEIMTANKIKGKINQFFDFVQINKRFPNSFSKIDFEYFNYNTSENQISEEQAQSISDYESVEPFISKIYQESTGSSDELEVIKLLLTKRRTRYSLHSIELITLNLSDCLSILSLCSNFIEVYKISLSYRQSDVEDEEVAIKAAITEFKANSGPIDELEIKKTEY